MHKTVVLLVTLSIAIYVTAEQHEATLTLEKRATGIVYSLNGKQLSSHEGFLLPLARLRDGDPEADPELTILASEDISFKQVGEVMGIASKAGYFRFRVFVFDKTRAVMYQVSYSKSMPFSSTQFPVTRQ